jgi:hypothetical protein
VLEMQMYVISLGYLEVALLLSCVGSYMYTVRDGKYGLEETYYALCCFKVGSLFDLLLATRTNEKGC